MEGRDRAIGTAGRDALRLLGALSRPGVLQILLALDQAPIAVSMLADQLEYEISVVSRHLHTLQKLELVQYERVGRNHLYRHTTAVQVNRTHDRSLVRISTKLGTSLQVTCMVP